MSRKLRTVLRENRDDEEDGAEGEGGWNGARPARRRDCVDVPRPCPFVGCRHHLLFDVSASGSIRYNGPTTDPLDLPPDLSCSLDVVDLRGRLTLEEVGALFHLVRERARQIEDEALSRLGFGGAFLRWRDECLN